MKSACFMPRGEVRWQIGYVSFGAGGAHGGELHLEIKVLGPRDALQAQAVVHDVR